MNKHSVGDIGMVFQWCEAVKKFIPVYNFVIPTEIYMMKPRTEFVAKALDVLGYSPEYFLDSKNFTHQMKASLDKLPEVFCVNQYLGKVNLHLGDYYFQVRTSFMIENIEYGGLDTLESQLWLWGT